MKLTELAQAIEDGRTINACVGNKWLGVNLTDRREIASALILCMDFPEKVRIAPQLKPIDLSVLIDSGIDCEFGSCAPAIGNTIGKLKSICPLPVGPRLYVGNVDGSGGNKEYQICQPRMGDHWHSWQGGERPLPEGLVVEYRMRDENYPLKAQNSDCLRWHWDSDLSDSDIIAFKIIGLVDGYCWPWQE